MCVYAWGSYGSGTSTILPSCWPTTCNIHEKIYAHTITSPYILLSSLALFINILSMNHLHNISMHVWKTAFFGILLRRFFTFFLMTSGISLVPYKQIFSIPLFHLFHGCKQCNLVSSFPSFLQSLGIQSYYLSSYIDNNNNNNFFSSFKLPIYKTTITLLHIPTLSKSLIH